MGIAKGIEIRIGIKIHRYENGVENRVETNMTMEWGEGIQNALWKGPLKKFIKQRQFTLTVNPPYFLLSNWNICTATIYINPFFVKLTISTVGKQQQYINLNKIHNTFTIYVHWFYPIFFLCGRCYTSLPKLTYILLKFNYGFILSQKFVKNTH